MGSFFFLSLQSVKLYAAQISSTIYNTLTKYNECAVEGHVIWLHLQHIVVILICIKPVTFMWAAMQEKGP